MTRRFHPRSTSKENMHLLLHSIPWKLLVIVPILVVLAIPTFIYGAHAGSNILPSVTSVFYKLSNLSTAASPTPLPAFATVLPQVGSVQAPVSDGDSCDSILAYRMHMYSSSQVFSDANPNTVKQLSHDVGQDCHRLQPGMTMTLSPQYPLVAISGVLSKIAAMTTLQVLPTPLIKVQSSDDYTPDCSGGCTLIVRVNPEVSVRLAVHTELALHPGDWIWAQAMLPSRSIPGFNNYPYADPHRSLNNMSLRTCDFQANDKHDDNSAACSDINPNTIDIDGGSWLLGVTGSNALDHWHYKIHAPAGTQVLLWLTDSNGTLTYHPGDPLYRYDAASHLYVKF